MRVEPDGGAYSDPHDFIDGDGGVHAKADAGGYLCRSINPAHYGERSADCSADCVADTDTDGDSERNGIHRPGWHATAGPVPTRVVQRRRIGAARYCLVEGKHLRRRPLRCARSRRWRRRSGSAGRGASFRVWRGGDVPVRRRVDQLLFRGSRHSRDRNDGA